MQRMITTKKERLSIISGSLLIHWSSCEVVRVNDAWEAVTRGSGARQAGYDVSSLKLIKIQLQPG